MRGRLSFLRWGAGRVGYGGWGVGARAPRTPRAGASDQATGGLSGCHGGRPPEPARTSRTQGPPHSGLSGWSSGWGGGPVGCPRGRLGPARCSRVRPQGPNSQRNAARAPRTKTPHGGPRRCLLMKISMQRRHSLGIERRSVEGIRKSPEPAEGDRRGRRVTILLRLFYFQERV